MGRKKMTRDPQEVRDRLNWVIEHRDPITVMPDDWADGDAVRLREISWALGVSERSLRAWITTARLPAPRRGFIPVSAVVAAFGDAE
jgi:hypothetical protein